MAEFKVKKGKKFFWGPRWNFIGINKGEFNVKVCFMDSCEYKLTKNYDQINKLTGQSYNMFPFYDKELKAWKPGHHKNSVRFGWRCIDGISIEIFAYAYIDKVRIFEKMLSINAGEWVHLNFKEKDGSYIFTAISENGDSHIVKFVGPTKKRLFIKLFISRLYPYFGGQISAPHNMRLQLKYFKKFI